MQMMNVPIFKGEGKLAYEDRPVPQPDGDRDVVIQVEACGICGTDLNILATPPAHKANLDIVIGHEAIGVVTEIGSDVSTLKPGDRVAVAPRLTCGNCDYCRRGIDNQCTNYNTIGTTVDGAFAPYLCAPESALFKMSDSVPRDDAVFFEPLSCVVGSVKRAPIEAGANVVVIGAGPMGLLFAQTYRTLGAGKVIVVDIAPFRLDFAKEVGIDATINPKEVDPVAAVKDLTSIGADVVVDAVGHQVGTAVEMTRRGGDIVLFGLRPHNEQTINQYRITRYDLTLHGTFVGLNPFQQTVQLLESRRLQPSNLITHRVPLTELAKGVDIMRSGEGMKVIVETQGSN